jgi:transcription elongation factor Elf1
MVVKKCRFCAEEVQVEAIKCKHCGSMLNYWEDETTPVPHETHQQVDANKHKISLEIPKMDPNKQILGLLLIIGATLLGLYGIYVLISGFFTYFTDDMGYFSTGILLGLGAAIVGGIGWAISPSLGISFECSVCSKPLVIDYVPSLTGEAAIVNCLKCETMHVVNWYEPN